MEIGYREMARLLGAGVVSTHRYCVTFLGLDAAAGRQGGKARKFNRREAFRVYLGMILNRDAGFTFPEAVTLVDLVIPVIEREKMLPEKPPAPPWTPVELMIYRADNEVGFYCTMRTTTERKKTARGTFAESYRVQEINPDPVSGAFPLYDDRVAVVVSLTRVINGFCTAEVSLQEE